MCETPESLINCLALAPVVGGLVVGIINHYDGDTFEVVWGDSSVRITYDQLNYNWCPQEKLQPEAGSLIGKLYETKEDALGELRRHYRVAPEK